MKWCSKTGQIGRIVLVFGVLVLLSALVGCREEKADTSATDPETQGVAPPLAEPTPGDMRVMRMQLTGVAMSQLQDQPTPVEQADPIAEVRDVVAEMQQLAQAQDWERFFSYFGGEAGPVLQEMLTLQDRRPQRLEELDRLFQQELGMPLPEPIRASLGANQAGYGPISEFQQIDLDAMNYQQVGDRVAVTLDDRPFMMFAKATNGKWEVQVEPQFQDVLGARLEFVQAQDRLIDEMASGLRNGTITAANWQSQFEAMNETYMGPKLARLMALEAAGQQQGGTEVEVTPSAQTPPDGAGPAGDSGTTMPAGGAEAGSGDAIGPYGFSSQALYRVNFPMMTKLDSGENHFLAIGEHVRVQGYDSEVGYRVEVYSEDQQLIGSGWSRDFMLDPNEMTPVP